MLIDTHAHLYLDRFGSDLPDVLARARERGVERIVMPAIDVPSIDKALALCKRYDGLYAMAALHPSDTKDATDDDFAAVAAFCDDPRVVAVGDDLAPEAMRSLDDSVHFLVRHCLPDRVWKQQASGALKADDVSAFANLIANSTSACISSIADCECADYCFDIIAKPRSP